MINYVINLMNNKKRICLICYQFHDFDKDILQAIVLFDDISNSKLLSSEKFLFRLID